MNDLDDPILDALHKRINDIAEMCHAHIKPGGPDSWIRSVRLFNELAKPYIDAMCEYVSTRQKFALPVRKVIQPGDAGARNSRRRGHF